MKCSRLPPAQKSAWCKENPTSSRDRQLLMTMLSTTTAFSFLMVVAASGSELTRVDVYPPEISLSTARDYQSLVVQATFADGTTSDVTSHAKLTFANPALVRLEQTTVYQLPTAKRN